jgi:hypothetical protein
MGQDATTVPPKGLGTLKLSDFWKSLFLAAIVNVLLVLYPIIQGGHWPTSTNLQDMLKSTVAIILAYLIKNLSTNNVGQVLQKDKPVVNVDVSTLNDLKEKANS